jgi:hypothetical protein
MDSPELRSQAMKWLSKKITRNQFQANLKTVKAAASMAFYFLACSH